MTASTDPTPPQKKAPLPIPGSDKSFAEALFTDAFNPGVHHQSLDATNYVLLALFVCSLLALVAWNYSIHFVVIISLGLGLAVLMNYHRGSILEASAEFFRQKAEDDAKKAEQEAKERQLEDEDEDYEYIYVDEDDEIPEGAEVIEEHELKSNPQQRKNATTATTTTKQ